MVINHAGALRTEYFIAYMNLIMNAFECSVEQARNLTFERLFQSKEDYLGNESYRQFLKAYEAIKQ
ncbi:hypothetical protein LIT32_04270 [Bacillus sp. CMF21]|uniref:hypothetical protein n=1 Tax=Metabacillus dongyingensis TaxID=2874282 RepID=UPI001CBE83D0|nr:hypothetical protein [Metabacillus dongyingensis]UAL53027.1 hypothetical protein K8L98_04245 [Metabacillus dongyingensis]UOK58604.1 hypothetical protein MGI18_05360 [Bacillus sp. OVS6]USK29347.1 hypothetical protein LIT32_04270 [Bacillus sp. CMF21]